MKKVIGVFSRIKLSVDNIVKLMYYCGADMENKENLVKSTIHDPIRVAEMYSCVEALPIKGHDGLEVTTREAHTIQSVGVNQSMSVTELSSYFGITKSAACQMVSKLVNKGFLIKKLSPFSDKEFQLFLSDLGWQAFDAHEKFHGKDMTELMKRLSGFSISQIDILSVFWKNLAGFMEKRLCDQLKK